MMAFGWRPNVSCYNNAAQVQAKQEACSSPTWWYVLLGAAVVAGVAGRKK